MPTTIKFMYYYILCTIKFYYYVLCTIIYTICTIIYIIMYHIYHYHTICTIIYTTMYHIIIMYYVPLSLCNRSCDFFFPVFLCKLAYFLMVSWFSEPGRKIEENEKSFSCVESASIGRLC